MRFNPKNITDADLLYESYFKGADTEDDAQEELVQQNSDYEFAMMVMFQLNMENIADDAPNPYDFIKANLKPLMLSSIFESIVSRFKWIKTSEEPKINLYSLCYMTSLKKPTVEDFVFNPDNTEAPARIMDGIKKAAESDDNNNKSYAKNVTFSWSIRFDINRDFMDMDTVLENLKTMLKNAVKIYRKYQELFPYKRGYVKNNPKVENFTFSLIKYNTKDEYDRNINIEISEPVQISEFQIFPAIEKLFPGYKSKNKGQNPLFDPLTDNEFFQRVTKNCVTSKIYDAEITSWSYDPYPVISPKIYVKVSGMKGALKNTYTNAVKFVKDFFDRTDEKMLKMLTPQNASAELNLVFDEGNCPVLPNKDLYYKNINGIYVKMFICEILANGDYLIHHGPDEKDALLYSAKSVKKFTEKNTQKLKKYQDELKKKLARRK